MTWLYTDPEAPPADGWWFTRWETHQEQHAVQVAAAGQAGSDEKDTEMSDERIRWLTRELAAELSLAPRRGEIEQAIRDLYAWAPEGGFPMVKGYYGTPQAEVGKAAFLSEAYLYELLGKEDARSLRGLIGRIAKLCGMDWRRQAAGRIDAKGRVRKSIKELTAALDAADGGDRAGPDKVYEAAQNLESDLETLLW